MKRVSVETFVGVFVLIGLACVGYLTIKLGKMEWFGGDNYPIYARFASVSGLKIGTHVEMAGVPIGKVESISLDPEKQIALVRMQIQNHVVLTDDAIASIKTSGLIGDKYIKLSPGGSDTILKPGDSIAETESALDIEELIGKFAFGKV
jgi:phospholipid/cholesterol/gamma-HCH transport system substrate-binding protein